MQHRILRAALTAGAACLLLAVPAQAHLRPIKLRTVERVALRDAYHWWHAKPCGGVRFAFQPLPPTWGMVGEPTACRIAIDPRQWTRAMFWHIEHNHYRSRTDPRGTGAWDPYGVETWQAFCGDVTFEVGAIIGHKPNDDPHSIMFDGPDGQVGSPAPMICGTSA